MGFQRFLLPGGAWLSSLGAHAAILAWLVAVGNTLPQRPPPALVSFSIVAPQSDTTPSATAPSPRPTRPSVAKAAKSPPRAATQAKPDEPIAKPAEAQAVDLSGVTLTAGDGASWSSMTGNGQAITEPIQPTVVTPSKTTKETAGAKRSAIAVAGREPTRLMDLADKPVPPVLDAKLRANYPADAKRQGISGTAKVLARVDADGLVRRASTLFESGEGFGAACRQTLLGSRWSTPRDRTGRAVPTQIQYTCQFRVDGS